jgi:hypothetical protein
MGAFVVDSDKDVGVCLKSREADCEGIYFVMIEGCECSHFDHLETREDFGCTLYEEKI